MSAGDRVTGTRRCNVLMETETTVGNDQRNNRSVGMRSCGHAGWREDARWFLTGSMAIAEKERERDRREWQSQMRWQMPNDVIIKYTHALSAGQSIRRQETKHSTCLNARCDWQLIRVRRVPCTSRLCAKRTFEWKSLSCHLYAHSSCIMHRTARG